MEFTRWNHNIGIDFYDVVINGKQTIWWNYEHKCWTSPGVNINKQLNQVDLVTAFFGIYEVDRTGRTDENWTVDNCQWDNSKHVVIPWSCRSWRPCFSSCSGFLKGSMMGKAKHIFWNIEKGTPSVIITYRLVVKNSGGPSIYQPTIGKRISIENRRGAPVSRLAGGTGFASHELLLYRFWNLHSASSSNNTKIKSSRSATLQLMCHHTLHIIIKFLAFSGKQTHRIPDFWFAGRQKAPSIRIDHD